MDGSHTCLGIPDFGPESRWARFLLDHIVEKLVEGPALFPRFCKDQCVVFFVEGRGVGITVYLYKRLSKYVHGIRGSLRSIKPTQKG